MPFVGLGQEIVTEDIDRFWTMYDQVVVEKDTLKQLELVQASRIQYSERSLLSSRNSGNACYF
jgi:hypothetical protein